MKDDLSILVSTMNRKTNDLQLIKDMNIKNDTIILNQSDSIGYHREVFNNYKAEIFSSIDRGVSKSRNELLMKAYSKYCLLADDDLVYVDNYKEIISNSFEKFPDADFIVFNVRIHQDGKIFEKVSSTGKVSFYNCLRYGSVSFCFNRYKIQKLNISFHLMFGPGGQYLSGEDSLFIWESIRKGLKVYAIKDVIADVYNDESTWFDGYNERYFFDKGALFKALSPRFYKILVRQFAIRKAKVLNSGFNIREIIRIMDRGAHSFKSI